MMAMQHCRVGMLAAVVDVFCAFTVVLAASAVHAQVKPGEYVAGRGYGVLRITPDKGDALRFQLNARGANFHVCELSGVIRNGESRMDDSADPKLPCIVTFKPDKGAIAVAAKHEQTCSTYCGARAHFEATYSMPPGACAPSHVRQTRNRFKVIYDRKLFSEASALLAPIAEKCGTYLTELDNAWVHNDLALTQHRAGDSAACRSTLKPWLELARTPDEILKGNYPPSDADAMLRIAQATRANLRLCGAAVTIGAQP